MQFFPTSTPANPADLFDAVKNTSPKLENTALSAVKNTSSKLDNTAFGNVLSSFIEEGRTDYSGRPVGFPAFEAQTGTISEKEIGILKESLRKRGVSEDSIEGLDALMASGTPLTVAKIFGNLSGESRRTATLDATEFDNFKSALTKLGFGKDEIDELVSMSDQGKTTAIMKRVSEQMKEQQSDLDINKSEFAALLRGLDASGKTQKYSLDLFGDSETRSLTRDELESLFAGIKGELDMRGLASDKAKQHMRAAMNDSLDATKRIQNAAPVESQRGSLRVDQSKELMQESLLKKAGENNILRMQLETSTDGNEKHDQDAQDSLKERARTERIFATNPEGTEKQAKTTTPPKTSLEQMLHRIDIADSSSKLQPATTSAQNLNKMANNFRQEIFSQVENGILQNAQNGSRQLTMQITPGDLGNLTVIINVVQGEVRAIIKAEQPDTTMVLREQMAELKASLEAQGLKVKELDVQTQLRDNSFAGQENGTQDHNLMQDARERNRMAQLSRLRREANAEAAHHGTLESHNTAASSNGLHIVA